jgi:O-antigen ligase
MKTASSPHPPTAARLAGLVFLALLPLTGLIPVTHVPYWLTQDLVLRWTAALVFLVLSFLAVRDGMGSSLRLDFPDLAVLALASWVLLAVRNSKEAFESFYAYRSFLAMLFWWFSLRLIWRKWSGLYALYERTLFYTAVFAASCVALTTLGHLLPQLRDRLVPRVGLFPNENIAAGFLGLALIWGTLRRFHGGWMPRWGLAVLFLGWCLTQSRGAFLAMGCVVVTYCLLHMKEIEHRLRLWDRRRWTLAICAVLAAVAFLSPMIDRLFNALETDPDAYKRFDLWVSLLKMVTVQPFYGFGPGTFSDVYPAFQPSSLWDKMVSLTHDEFLQVTVECGIPALLLTLLFLSVLLRRTGKDLTETGVFRPNKPPLEAFECAFFLIFFESVHNLVDFTFHEWSHRLVLFAFTTYALEQKKPPEEVEAEVRFSRPACIAAAGAMAVFLLWALGIGAFRDYLSRMYDYQAVVSLGQGDTDRAEALDRESLRYRMNNMDPWNTLGAIEDSRAGWSKTLREKERHFQAADAYFRRAIELSPYSLTPVENEVGDLTKRGKLIEALDLQDQLVQRAPAFPVGYLNLGLLQLKMGKAPQAVLSAEEALAIAPYYLQAHILKAEALEAAGRPQDALEEYQLLQGWRLSPDVTARVEANLQRLEKTIR